MILSETDLPGAYVMLERRGIERGFFGAIKAEGGVRWDDPAFGIDWPDPQNAFLSEKDRNWPDSTG